MTYGDVYGDIYGDVPGEGDSSVAYVKFVDAVGSLTTRLDLSPGTGLLQVSGGSGRVDDGVDFGRPKLTAVTADGALGDGDPYVASSYGNVRFTLPLVLPARASMDARQSALTALARELDRPVNVLYVQPEGATTGRWMITYRHSDAAGWLRLASRFTAAETEITIDRMPFAYGPSTAVTIGTASGDPEQGTYTFTLAQAAGDVDAPMTLTAFVGAGPTGTPPQKFYVAVKERTYTDGPLKYVLAAPDAAITNVASTVTTGAAGAAGTAYRWSPPSSAEAYIFGGSLPDFVSPPTPAAAKELIGRWRILARVKRNTVGDVFTLRARTRTGATGTNTGALLRPDSPVTFGGTGGWTYLDMGILQIPTMGLFGDDPWGDQPATTTQGVEVYATRVSGTGTLDVDHLVALPADGRTLIADMGGNDLITAGDAFVVDGDRTSAYIVRDYSGARYIRGNRTPVGFDGSPLRISPRYTSLMVVVPDAADPGVITSTLNLVGAYRPRYLEAM